MVEARQRRRPEEAVRVESSLLAIVRAAIRWILAGGLLGLLALASLSGGSWSGDAPVEPIHLTYIDGRLDCPMEGRYSWVLSVSADAVGEPTSAEAAVKALGPFMEAHGGRTYTDSGPSGTLAVDDREVVLVKPEELRDGRGWMVMTTTWCPGFGLD